MKKRESLIPFFAVMFVFNMAANFVHPVTPSIIVDLQLNDYMFGLALSAMMALNFFFSPFWGKMAGYLSSKKVLLICGLGYALGQVFFGVAQTEIQFLLARMFAGAFAGGSYVAFLTYTVNCSPEENRGRNLTIHATLIATSSSFGYFVGGMIGELGVYYAVWLQVGTLVLCALAHFLLCREDGQQDIHALTGRQLIRECNPFAAIAQCRQYMTPLIALLFLAYGLGNLGYIAFEQSFNYFLRDQFQLTSGYNGVIKAALGLISLLANSTLCMWILKQKRVSPYLAGVMGICTAAMIGVIFFDAMIPFVLVNILFFAFYFISQPLMQNQAAALGQGQYSNLVMGSFNAVKSFGSIFGSALAGFIYEMHVKLPFVFGFAAFAAAAGMMLLFIRREKKQTA
ncbi:MAG: MFS transporter [Clostridia bacterium]|nr:MFS transporter [Clostridia bacterium]